MIQIGSNFDYQAPFYLDARQYIEVPAGSMYYDVLHTLSNELSMPDGFEVYCNGNWWTFDSSNEDTITGRFRLRSGGGGEQPELKVSIVSPSGSSLYIPYNQSLDSIEVIWSVSYGDISTKPNTLTIIIEDNEYPVMNPLANGSTTVVPVSPINGGDRLEVVATFSGEVATQSKTFIQTFTKYWGVSSNPTIEDFSELTEVQNATSANLSQTFNCTGGKYPYYAMPLPLYQQVANRLKMFVDGWENTAYSVSSLEIENEIFAVIRHDLLQTGILNIIFTA